MDRSERTDIKGRGPAEAEGRATRRARRTRSRGLSLSRKFSCPGVHPFDEIEWDLRSATITNERGELIFEQRDCEIPKAWSQLATNVVVSKYFRGHLGTSERESSVKQLIGRVVDTLARWGRGGGYFADAEQQEILFDWSGPLYWTPEQLWHRRIPDDIPPHWRHRGAFFIEPAGRCRRIAGRQNPPA